MCWRFPNTLRKWEKDGLIKSHTHAEGIGAIFPRKYGVLAPSKILTHHSLVLEARLCKQLGAVAKNTSL
jgi:hypothetical protein